MTQVFNPDKVMLMDSLGKDVKITNFTNLFAEGLKKQSLVTQLGERIEMGDQYIKDVHGNIGELSDAYIVGEAEKIGTAKLNGVTYTLRTQKVATILPVSNEFLTYTWTQYFNHVLPSVVDKFSKIIDSGTFLGNYRGTKNANPFGGNVIAKATEAGNALTAPLTVDTIFDLEALVEGTPNAFFGKVNGDRPLRGLVDTVANERIYDRTAKTLDGINYYDLAIPTGDEYPDNALIVADTTGIKYGLPQGTGLRIKIADQATLSTVQNTNPDTGDVHMFEQDMQAARFIFEIAIAIPEGNKFAVLTPETVEVP